ncbi:MAG: hypothetical protein FJY85_05700 [Deltaproteobacteria bacterium]|nr:hypothetical protein [Deltaproteobacteria bacterium]
MLERLDNLGRHMERVVKELRVNRDAADEIGKSLLDGLKLEGEITNKTLSIGFSDLNRKVENLGLKTEKVTSMKRTETDGKQES